MQYTIRTISEIAMILFIIVNTISVNSISKRVKKLEDKSLNRRGQSNGKK